MRELHLTRHIEESSTCANGSEAPQINEIPIYACINGRDAELACYACEPVSYLEKVAYREHLGWHPSEPWQHPEEYAQVVRDAKRREWDFSNVQ